MYFAGPVSECILFLLLLRNCPEPESHPHAADLDTEDQTSFQCTPTTATGTVKMRGAVLGCLLLVCAVLLLVEQAEGHITFFSPQQMEEMRVTTRVPSVEV
ncbi:hypothetical protein AALO_G00170050 [Alosa alosa]|uniref:Uncharacterized protein n=1 Tax=Alosa alosa TaxID=278164 RepID=A0AAV6GHE2_9TELE|nr:hypothetical protein AALO_G00170050 [Alosa alosa]